MLLERSEALSQRQLYSIIELSSEQHLHSVNLDSIDFKSFFFQREVRVQCQPQLPNLPSCLWVRTFTQATTSNQRQSVIIFSNSKNSLKIQLKSSMGCPRCFWFSYIEINAQLWRRAWRPTFAVSIHGFSSFSSADLTAYWRFFVRVPNSLSSGFSEASSLNTH